ncbi:MAG: response regulator [Tepidisphaeraceae bacterium]
MSDVERKALLDKLDAADAENPAKNRRSQARVTFRKAEVACRIYHPGGSVTTSTVATRNLSTGGISFIYHGFLHKSTKVEIVLQRRLGGEDIVGGIVTHCQHLNRAYHLIGVRFSSKIFAKLYLEPTEWNELGDGAPVDPAKLLGNVLHFDASEIDRLLLRHNLSTTKIELTSVATLDEAEAAIKSKSFDCILCDTATLNQPFTVVLAALRATGFKGPVGLVTAETSASVLKAATDSGAASILAKPYDAQKLMSLLSTWLGSDVGQAEAVYSTLPDSPTTRPLIEQYVSRVRAMSRELRQVVEGGDIKAVRNICQTLRGTGSGFGFPSLSQHAKDAVTSLDATASVQDAMVHLQRLEQTCRGLAFKAAA